MLIITIVAGSQAHVIGEYFLGVVGEVTIEVFRVGYDCIVMEFVSL